MKAITLARSLVEEEMEERDIRFKYWLRILLQYVGSYRASTERQMSKRSAARPAAAGRLSPTPLLNM